MPLADPYRLFDAGLLSDGAAAVLRATREWAERHSPTFVDRSPVAVLGTGSSTNHPRRSNRQEEMFPHFAAKRRAARHAYREAGIDQPSQQIDVAEVYDSFSSVGPNSRPRGPGSMPHGGGSRGRRAGPLRPRRAGIRQHIRRSHGARIGGRRHRHSPGGRDRRPAPRRSPRSAGGSRRPDGHHRHPRRGRLAGGGQRVSTHPVSPSGRSAHLPVPVGMEQRRSSVSHPSCTLYITKHLCRSRALPIGSTGPSAHEASRSGEPPSRPPAGHGRPRSDQERWWWGRARREAPVRGRPVFAFSGPVLRSRRGRWGGRLMRVVGSQRATTPSGDVFSLLHIEMVHRYRHAVGSADPFYRGLDGGVLRATRCPGCRSSPFGPRRFCPDDLSPTAWYDLPGAGRIVAASRVHVPPPFGGIAVPYILASIRPDGVDGAVTHRVVGDDVPERGYRGDGGVHRPRARPSAVADRVRSRSQGVTA